MITLEQVQKLDAKIKQAVSLISTLREENAQLRSTLSGYENKITDLEEIVSSLEDGQTKIELSLIEAISKLDDIDVVTQYKEEPSVELSPSKETEIVDDNAHASDILESDHSEQTENITEDSLDSNDAPILDVEIESEDDKDEDISIEKEVVSENEEVTNENEDVITENDIVLEDNSDNTVEKNVDANDIPTEQPMVELEESEKSDDLEKKVVSEKKKNNDYSIPMLEIF